MRFCLLKFLPAMFIFGKWKALGNTHLTEHIMPTSLVVSHLNHGAEFGSLGHRQNIKFLFGWPSATHCWTADRLAKRNLPHLARCPLCDQADEDIQHLLTTFVFAREFWFKVFQPLGL